MADGSFSWIYSPMLDVLLYGIYALDAAATHRIVFVPILELARTPGPINAGIIGALLVPLVMQARVRDVLTALGLVCLLVITGLIFTTLLLAAIVVVFFVARMLHRWAVGSGNHSLPLLVGWIIVNAMYLPVFFVILPPFRGYMSWGEVSLLWGPAFAVFRSLNYIHQVCTKKVDPNERGAFGRFLLYQVHFASFWFGPFQKFSQFDEEVSTCKERITTRNRMMGLFRIGLAIVKFLIIFHWINRAFFYRYGYMGPFTDNLFANANDAGPGHLWFMMYLFTIRIILFISAVSDGVIGMNLLMGIRVPENSIYPLLSKDILDFWRRWHSQAMVFLRDDVFFPVGGRKKRVRGFFCVFAYSGFWHFPTITSVLAFPLLQLALIEATLAMKNFWKRHKRAKDRISVIGKRLHLYDSPMVQVWNAILIFHVNMLSIMFIHDHFYGGTKLLPRMLGF
ncbi:MAG: hypothetical protein KDJ16_09510 [Hyphomicrobiales bacterium]|nr:hypothetical protein [Hyphomicrobiales bacterium]